MAHMNNKKDTTLTSIVAEKAQNLELPTQPKKNETPRDLRKKNSRLLKSREDIKEKSYQKSLQLTAVKGRAVELEDSRDLWRKKHKESEKEKAKVKSDSNAKDEIIQRLQLQVQEQERFIEMEKELKQKEHESYRIKIEELKKKLKNMGE